MSRRILARYPLSVGDRSTDTNLGDTCIRFILLVDVCGCVVAAALVAAMSKLDRQFNWWNPIAKCAWADHACSAHFRAGTMLRSSAERSERLCRHEILHRAFADTIALCCRLLPPASSYLFHRLPSARVRSTTSAAGLLSSPSAAGLRRSTPAGLLWATPASTRLRSAASGPKGRRRRRPRCLLRVLCWYARVLLSRGPLS